MPEVTRRLRAHFDDRASSYANAAPWVTDPSSLHPIAQVVAATRARRVVEVGVGAGAVPAFLRWNSVLPDCYIGLDLSAAMLQLADVCSAVQGDASHLPFRDGSIDLLIARQVFHYLEHPSHTIAEALRVLRPSGTMLVAQLTPFDHDADIDWWSRAVTLRQPLRRHLWTAASLEVELRASGISVEAIAQVTGNSSLRNWLDRYPLDEAAAQELIAHFRRAPDAVRRVRDFEFRSDGDIRFLIRWSILFGHLSSADVEPR